MSALKYHVSNKTDVLRVAFGPGWRELLASIAWELLDSMNPNETAFTIQKWFINVHVTWGHIAVAVTLLFGPRP